MEEEVWFGNYEENQKVLKFLCDISSLTLLQISCVAWERRIVCHRIITSAEFWI